MEKKNQYLDLVGFTTPEQAYKKIKEWTSGLTDDDHFVRSVIFDIHAGIEILFRQIFYHYFKPRRLDGALPYTRAFGKRNGVCL